MNRIVWGIVGSLWFCTLTARGQGTLNFATKVTGAVDARAIYCVTPLGSDYVGQLYAGSPGGVLTPVGTPVPFRNDAGAGYITAGGKVVVPGIPGGSPAAVELRAWKSSLGATYEAALAAGGGIWMVRSPSFVVTLGGGGTPPAPDANLVGLQGFMIDCPEPSVLVLAALGAGVLGWRRRGGVGRRR